MSMKMLDTYGNVMMEIVVQLIAAAPQQIMNAYTMKQNLVMGMESVRRESFHGLRIVQRPVMTVINVLRIHITILKADA